MKNLKHTLFALLALAAFTQVNAQADKKPSAQEQAWMNYMTPGKEHQMLARSVGTWDEEVTMWMDPKGPATKSTATSVNTLILGGRYLQTMNTGNFSGMPFEGVGITGFDNAKKVYVSTWYDNMGTGILFMEGKYNEVTKMITFRGRQVDPVTGKDMGVRQTLKFVDDNMEVIEMYMGDATKEFKSMEITLKRK